MAAFQTVDSAEAEEKRRKEIEAEAAAEVTGGQATGITIGKKGSIGKKGRATSAPDVSDHDATALTKNKLKAVSVRSCRAVRGDCE